MIKILPKHIRPCLLQFIFIILCFLLFQVKILNAHPHVFIAQRLKIIFDDKGLAGFNVRWEFDDMFSTMISEDHDLNKNGVIEKTESMSIKEKAFSYIAKNNYFIYVEIDETPFQVKYVTNFSAALENGKLSYDFFVPCHVRAIKKLKHINIASYDPTYYSAIYFIDPHPYAIEANEKFEVIAQVKEDPDTSIYYDMIHPWTLFLNFRLTK